MKDESSLLFVLKEDSERHERQPWPSDGIPASYLHMCSICLASCLCVCVCACVRASFICQACPVALPPCQFSCPTQPFPPAPIRRPRKHKRKQELINRGRRKMFSYLDRVDWCGWWGVTGGRGGSEEKGERKRKHKEKAWLVCGFGTCNLSYGELSCSLLFGSNRLMPRVRLNKSFMRSSGQKKTASPLLLSVVEGSLLWEKRAVLAFWILHS